MAWHAGSVHAIGVPEVGLWAPASQSGCAGGPPSPDLNPRSPAGGATDLQGAAVAGRAEAPDEGLAALWEVVSDKLLVREARPLGSKKIGDLKQGALLRQLSLTARRLHYKLHEGKGPATGWVTIQTQGGVLAERRRNLGASLKITSSPVLPPASGETGEAHEQHKTIGASHAENEVHAAAPAGSAAEAAPTSGGPQAIAGAQEQAIAGAQEEATHQGHEAAAVPVPAVPAGWSRADTPKRIWTYWDQGKDAMPWFNWLCVETWRAQNPEWEVVVVGRETVTKWLPTEWLPVTFNRIQMHQHRADCVKSALLLRYGGIYMDSSIIVWQELEKIVGWEDILAGRNRLTAYYKEKKHFVENYFLASRQDSPLMASWHQVHKEFWGTRTSCGNLKKDPFFEGVDLTRDISAENSSYLAQHACYMKLYDRDQEDFRELALEAKLIDTEGPTGALWVFGRLGMQATLRLRRARGLSWAAGVHAWTHDLPLRGSTRVLSKGPWTMPPAHHRCPMDWNQAMLEVLHGSVSARPCVEVVEAVERNRVPLAKFTSHVNLSGAYRRELLRSDSVVGRLFAKAGQKVSR